MQNFSFSAGDTIKARCTKCRKNTDHLILAVTDGDPVKVQCDLCDRQHTYRPPTAAKKVAVKKRVTDPKEVERKEWELLRPDMNSAKAVAYSMNQTYKVRTLINHPVFGLGLVQRIAGPRKIEVLFEDGRKTMRCQ